MYAINYFPSLLFSIENHHVEIQNEMIYHTIIGKSAESEKLSWLVKEAGRGNPQIGFVSGAAGVGKSTLIRNIEYPPGFKVFETIVPEEESPSYSIIANFLRQTDIPGKLQKQNSNPAALYIGYFLPEIHRKKGPPANFDVLVSVFRDIISDLTKTNPVVWIIEDLQWADLASLEILANLFITSTPLSFALIATYRNEQISSVRTIRRIRTKLRRNRGFYEVELQPFTQNEVSEFIEKRFTTIPSPDLVEALYYQTGGLPLLMNEFLDTLHKRDLLHTENNELKLKKINYLPIPENIRDLVILHLDELTLEARDLSEIAASYGNEFSFGILEKFTSSDHSIDELLEKGIIIEKKPGICSFRHTLYRETIRSEIAWSKRKEIYRKIAEEMEKMEVSPAILADFYNKAGMTHKARPAYIRSARQSCDTHAYHDAARMAEKALSNWPKGEDEQERLNLLVDFAHCSKVSGNMNNAIKALREITASDLASGNLGLLASTYRELAACYALKSSWNNYQESRLKSIELFNTSGNFADAALEQMDLAEFLFKNLKLKDALKIIDKALRNAENSERQDIYARCLALKGYLLAISGNSDEGVELANNAIHLGLQQNDTLATAEAYRRLAGALEYASSFQESLKAYDIAFHYCNTHRLDYQETQCLSCMSWVLMRTGEWRKCFETCRTVLEHPSTMNVSKCTANGILALIRAYRGELKTARKNLHDTFRLAGKEGSKLHLLISYWPASVISVVEGKQEEAYSNFCKMIDLWSETEDRHDSIAGFCDAISFFAINNHLTEINKCIHALSEIANQTKNAEAFGILSFAIGVSLEAKNEFNDATEHLQKAIEFLEPINIPLQSAMIQYHLGLVHMKQRFPEKSRIHLDLAYQTFKKLGIRYWCSMIEHQLKENVTSMKKSGLLQTAVSNSGSLTERQLEILELLTTGMSNKEIASRINLSTRTVDMHIRNTFERLNCRTRTEAAKIAFDTGLVKAQ
jgi:DNA-binding CsgD family transcriptional regulator